MKWLKKLYASFISALAKSVAEHTMALKVKEEWLIANAKHLHRAKAIAIIENADKANDFEYLKYIVENSQSTANSTTYSKSNYEQWLHTQEAKKGNN